MSDLSNDTKKHTMKSRETIPLKGQIWETLYGNIDIIFKGFHLTQEQQAEVERISSLHIDRNTT
jgi:hypothetical protein